MRSYLYSMLVVFSWIAVLLACQSQETNSEENADETVTEVANPAMPGFDMENSDPEAIELADLVMEAMGGRKQWDDLHYTTWVFFGNRKHTWDKYSGDVRVDYLRDTVHRKVVLFNVHDMEGKVQMDGQELADADSASKLIQAAKSHWINDMYWLFMPFKMKDDGVTLKYAGQDTTETGAMAEVVEMTFEEVGDTPQNKYHVFIDPETHMVVQWNYFADASDESPRFKSSWEGYDTYGGIKLSSDRMFYGNTMRYLTEIAVMDTLEQDILKAF